MHVPECFRSVTLYFICLFHGLFVYICLAIIIWLFLHTIERYYSSNLNLLNVVSKIGKEMNAYNLTINRLLFCYVIMELNHYKCKFIMMVFADDF